MITKADYTYSLDVMTYINNNNSNNNHNNNAPTCVPSSINRRECKGTATLEQHD